MGGVSGVGAGMNVEVRAELLLPPQGEARSGRVPTQNATAFCVGPGGGLGRGRWHFFRIRWLVRVFRFLGVFGVGI